MFSCVTMILSQAEDRATQGCDPSVAWDPRVDGPASLRGVGLFFRVMNPNSRLSSSSTCGPTAINPCGPTAFRGLYQTNYPYVLGQPLATGTFSLLTARHKMGMRHRTAQLHAGLADGCPAADHRVAGLVRAQCCLRSWGFLGFTSSINDPSESSNWRHPCKACREPSGKANSSKKRRPALPNKSLKSWRIP